MPPGSFAAFHGGRHRGGVAALPTASLNIDGLGSGPPHLLPCVIPATVCPCGDSPVHVARCRMPRNVVGQYADLAFTPLSCPL